MKRQGRQLQSKRVNLGDRKDGLTARSIRSLLVAGIVLTGLGLGVGQTPLVAQAWQSDQGDGTYKNPPLYADYPDPDIIRVGGDFYFATTTFANTPGLTILHSKDLVNWELISHVVPRLEGREQYDLRNGNAYRSGVFAPSLRYHDGVFYVAVTPVGQNTRLYSARDPRGPWTFVELDRPAFDPGLFFDTDGKGYIVTSGGWDGTVTLLSLSDDYRHVVSDRKVHFNKGAEGSKLIKRGDYYYLFNAIPARLALTVSRAHNLLGPWETRDQIDDRTGGHQGALVDLPDGRDFGFVMIDAGSIGRMTNISPVFWKDGWPVWGTPQEPGKVPARATKPVAGFPQTQIPTSDEFVASQLGLQWQWNHNPDDQKWSLSERPGYLRLKSTGGDRFWSARNTLTQKGQGPWSRADVRIDASHIRRGDQCGFGTLGKYNGQIVLSRNARDQLTLGMRLIEDQGEDGQKEEVRVRDRSLSAPEIFLRTELDFESGQGQLSYSSDGRSWTGVGGSFPIAYDWRTGTFQGPQYALFCYSKGQAGGWMDVDWFHFGGRQP